MAPEQLHMIKRIKTYLEFSNGEIVSSGKYEPEVSNDAVAIESAKFFLRHFIKTQKVSGAINIESRDGRLYFACTVSPKKIQALLEKQLKERFGKANR